MKSNIQEISNYIISKYPNSSVALWLSGNEYYEQNSNKIFFAASISKIFFGLYFLNDIESCNIKLKEVINYKITNIIYKDFYRLMINNENVDAFSKYLYKKLNTKSIEILRNYYKKYKDKNNIEYKDLDSANVLINFPIITFATILKYIFARSSNTALELMVIFYKNRQVNLQDETQKLIDSILGKNCTTVINNSFKETDSWNVTTLKESMEIFSTFILKCERHPKIKQHLNHIANKHTEFNADYKPILIEKSGWFPNYPLTEKNYSQPKLVSDLEFTNYKYATFISCLTYNPETNNYIGYSVSVPHTNPNGDEIIKNVGKLVKNTLIDYL